MRGYKFAAALAFVFTIGLIGGVADAQPFSGIWRNVLVAKEAATGPNCIYIQFETRTYSLTAQDNGGVIGNYMRGIESFYTRFDSECASLPVYRLDTWLLSGQADADGTLSVSANWTNCAGDCQAVVGAKAFSTALTVTGDKLVDRGIPSIPDPLTFVRKAKATDDEIHATQALRPLMEPLLNGNCNEFYEKSLDVSGQFASESDTCEVLSKIGTLLEPVLYDKAGWAYRLSQDGQEGYRPRILAGDVLLARYFVMDADGGQVSVTAVLRKQADGSWRIIRFL